MGGIILAILKAKTIPLDGGNAPERQEAPQKSHGEDLIRFDFKLTHYLEHRKRRQKRYHFLADLLFPQQTFL